METANKDKQVTLRAFTIENNDLTKVDSGLLGLLSKKLQNSKAKERRMFLNADDPLREEDLISDYGVKENIHVSGAILRIMPGMDAVSIPDELFDKEKIVFADLNSLEASTSSIYKDIQYFLLNDNTLITCWFGNKTIKSIQTYINWLLESERGENIFEFTPKVIPVPPVQMGGLKGIKMQDSAVYPQSNLEGQNTFQKVIKGLSKNIVKDLFKTVKDLDETVIEEIISAELMIRFKKKPKEMNQEDYNKIIGAYMKPISDTENVIFLPKKGKPIKGNDVLKVKQVAIETTETNKLSEKQLYQEMEIFIQEIKNENKS